MALTVAEVSVETLRIFQSQPLRYYLHLLAVLKVKLGNVWDWLDSKGDMAKCYERGARSEERGAEIINDKEPINYNLKRLVFHIRFLMMMNSLILTSIVWNNNRRRYILNTQF